MCLTRFAFVTIHYGVRKPQVRSRHVLYMVCHISKCKFGQFAFHLLFGFKHNFFFKVKLLFADKKKVRSFFFFNTENKIILVTGTETMHIIAVYAAPTVSRRSGLWGQLKQLMENIDEPVVIGGDFNTILRLDERTGGNGRLSPDSLAFGEWINELALVDIGFKGNMFTWRRGKETRNLWRSV